MTDVELDERVTALEENGGTANGKYISFNIKCLNLISFSMGIKLMQCMKDKLYTLDNLHFRHNRLPHGADILLHDP